MPRYARNKILSNFIHVIIQGINKEYIFNDEMEIKIYLKYLREKIQKTNVKIIAYCMMNNHAHFLMYYDNINEISKLMRQINTKYAIFYNKKKDRCGYVFRNRYKTEEILTNAHLRICIKYIHNNPVKAGMCENASDYKYSSYNEYKNKRGIILDWKFIENDLKKFDIDINEILDEYDDNFENENFIDVDDELYDKEIFKKNILKDYMEKNSIKSINEFKDNKKFLKEIANIMCCEYKFSQKEIAELIHINRLRINRILKEQ